MSTVEGAPTALEVRLPAALEGERIDRVVAMVTGLSRSAAADLVTRGAVRLDGTVTTARSARVKGEEHLAVEWEPSDAPDLLAPDDTVPFRVVFEDEHLLVIDKPAGVVVHPGNGVRGATLCAGLLARYPDLREVGEAHRPGIVHRLDRGTSGLLVVARTTELYEALVALLSDHDVHRRYRALVLGHPASAAGVVDAPIGRSRHDPTRRAVTADGKAARTHYRVVRTYGSPEPVTELDCELETGRTHQIRVHLQAIGHSVVADPLYGGGRLTLGLERPFLHAAELAFVHPHTGEELAFSSELPDDLRAALDQLG